MNKDFALKLFEGFSINRWNDLVRPFELVEMDKEAEKMFLAYIIGKYEEASGKKINWEWMIYASLFDLLRKIALSDIKNPVQNIIKYKYPEEYKKLSEWILEQYKNIIDTPALFDRFNEYINLISGQTKMDSELALTVHVFKAAHKYSTLRELEMIAPVNERERLEQIFKEVNCDIQKFLDLKGVQLLITKQKPFEFLMKIEQLRFQTRWNQTPRVPATSVLGHCFFVAILTLIFLNESAIQICPKRLYNDYFSALFHDLPESVTRDIISPVKQATDGFPSIVKDIEDLIVKEQLVPYMEDFYRDEVLYFTSNEFSDRILQSGKVVEVEFNELNSLYNDDRFNPVDGKLVRLADHYSALLEANASILHGITSSHLREGKTNLIHSYPQGKIINGIDAFALFSDFA